MFNKKKNDHTAWGWRLGWGSSISLELLVSNSKNEKNISDVNQCCNLIHIFKILFINEKTKAPFDVAHVYHRTNEFQQNYCYAGTISKLSHSLLPVFERIVGR